MAGYKVFYKSSYQEICDTLLEIGISLSYDDGIYTVTFSDSKSASFYLTGEIGAYLTDRWIFADDGSHTFIAFDGSGNPAGSGVTPYTTPSTFRLRVFIAEQDDGNIYSNNGFDGGSTLTSRALSAIANFPEMDAARLSNNDPALTELKLLPLVGNFYFANVSGSTVNINDYRMFKHAYVNYRRWFPLGTVIRGANGETYMGWGWILFRLGANS